MYSLAQRVVLHLGLALSLSAVVWLPLNLVFPGFRPGDAWPRLGGRYGAVPDLPARTSPQHYILTKLVMFNPTPGEESTLDGRFMDMAGPELSSRIEIRSSNDYWGVKECGSIKSCEVVSIEISQDRGVIHYTAQTKLINPAPSDTHPPLKLTADCPIMAGQTERDLLNECHIPQVREFARELTSHDRSKHGGNP